MIVNHLLNATRCGNILNLEMDTFLFDKKSVKMPLTRVQSAWVNSPSETQRSAFSTIKKLPKNFDFPQWFVGIVDGDGDFSFNLQKNSWSFCFKISQSSYNLRLLYFIKSNLKVGTITVIDSESMAYFRVRDTDLLIKRILPIFNEHPLLTYKYLLFDLFKKALLIMWLKPDNWYNQILELKVQYNEVKKLSQDCRSGYLPAVIQSPVWATLSDSLLKQEVMKLVTKAWLVGFTEAEGSFYIYKKNKNRMAHAFEITQKHDEIVLKAISLILPLKVIRKKNHFRLIGTNISSVRMISEYFFKSMKGMKSLEYRLWSRSFHKRHRGFEYLHSIQQKMRQIRSIKFGTNYKKVG
jgi:LAGLIDADG endonuclease